MCFAFYPGMVNLVFTIGKYARLNLPGEMEGTVATDRKKGAVRVLVARRRDIDWMVDQALVGAPCRVEFPDKEHRRAVFNSISDRKEGFVLEGRFVSGNRKDL